MFRRIYSACKTLVQVVSVEEDTSAGYLRELLGLLRKFYKFHSYILQKREYLHKTLV